MSVTNKWQNKLQYLYWKIEDDKRYYYNHLADCSTRVYRRHGVKKIHYNYTVEEYIHYHKERAGVYEVNKCLEN